MKRLTMDALVKVVDTMTAYDNPPGKIVFHCESDAREALRDICHGELPDVLQVGGVILRVRIDRRMRLDHCQLMPYTREDALEDAMRELVDLWDDLCMENVHDLEVYEDAIERARKALEVE